MKAELLLRERVIIGESIFVELVVWHLPHPLRGSAHRFKYRLSLVAEGSCVLRYDNEAGKGDHRHAGDVETAYHFTGPAQLQSDFWADVAAWRSTR